MARAAAVKNKHALEEQEYLLRTKREQLELDTEIAVTGAKLAVLKASGCNKSSIVSRHSDGMESYFKKEAKPKSKSTSLNPQATQFVPPSLQQHVSLHSPQGYAVPVSEDEVASDLNAAYNDQQLDPTTCTVNTISEPLVSKGDPAVAQNTPPPPGQNQPAVDHYSVLQQQNDITALLVQMQTSQLLPHWEIPTYDGDPLQFNSFMKAFEHCVEAKTYCKGDEFLRQPQTCWRMLTYQ